MILVGANIQLCQTKCASMRTEFQALLQELETKKDDIVEFIKNTDKSIASVSLLQESSEKQSLVNLTFPFNKSALKSAKKNLVDNKKFLASQLILVSNEIIAVKEEIVRSIGPPVGVIVEKINSLTSNKHGRVTSGSSAHILTLDVMNQINRQLHNCILNCNRKLQLLMDYYKKVDNHYFPVNENPPTKKVRFEVPTLADIHEPFKELAFTMISNLWKLEKAHQIFLMNKIIEDDLDENVDGDDVCKFFNLVCANIIRMVNEINIMESPYEIFGQIWISDFNNLLHMNRSQSKNGQNNLVFFHDNLVFRSRKQPYNTLQEDPSCVKADFLPSESNFMRKVKQYYSFSPSSTSHESETNFVYFMKLMGFDSMWPTNKSISLGTFLKKAFGVEVKVTNDRKNIYYGFEAIYNVNNDLDQHLENEFHTLFFKSFEYLDEEDSTSSKGFVLEKNLLSFLKSSNLDVFGYPPFIDDDIIKKFKRLLKAYNTVKKGNNNLKEKV